MTRTTVALAALLIALAARPVSAQGIGTYNPPGQPFARQPVSPYLNMFRGGSPGINYFGIVRPQLETDRYIQQQEMLAAQQQAHPGTGATVITMTGHPTRFLSYSQYFMTQGGGGTAGTTGGPQTVTGGAPVTTPAQLTQRLGPR